MLVVLLFLVSCVFAQEDCFKTWYYIENPTVQQEQQALHDGCFHGTYGPISILSCEYEGSKLLTKQSCTASLCIVETPQSEALLQKISDKNAEDDRKNTEFVLRVEQSHVLVSADGSYSCLELELARPEATIITVNQDSWKPPRQSLSFVYNLTAPDPTIAEVLKDVSATRMQSYIVTLASETIYTRQSQSQGAWDAEYWLETQFRNFGFTVSRYLFRSDMSDVVIAEILGDIASEVIVVGAHYDSRSTNSGSTTQRAPGADDNASGTSALLELATLISQHELSFRRTIRLVCFSGEEQGLLGSRAYAQYLYNRRENVIAMFNGDMLGWKQTTQPITLGMMNRYVDPALVTQANAITRDYVPELPVGTTAGCCSDQQSFTEYGFSAVGYFENTANSVVYPYYHQSTDLPQYINQQQLGLEGKALMAAALTYAGAYKDM